MTDDRESATEVGRELSRLIKAGQEDDAERVRDLMTRLVEARSETAEDALVLSMWAGSLFREMARAIPAQLPGIDGDVRYCLAVCGALMLRATTALETITRTPVETMTGEIRHVH